MQRKPICKSSWFSCALLTLLLAASLAASAVPPPPPPSTFTVTRFDDTNAKKTVTGDGLGAGNSGDLRFELLAAMAAGGTNTVDFQGCTTASPCTISLEGPLPAIFESSGSLNLTIDGGEEGAVLLDGGNQYRVFFVDNVTVSLKNLVIENAKAQGGNGGAGAWSGGGGAGFGAGLFVNKATAVVTVENSYFLNNAAAGGNGGITGLSGGGGGGGLGFAGGAGFEGNISGITSARSVDNIGASTPGGGGGGGVTGLGGAASNSPDLVSARPNAPAGGMVGGSGGSGGGGGGAGTSGGIGGLGYAADGAGSTGGNYNSGIGGAGGFGGGGGGGGYYLSGPTSIVTSKRESVDPMTIAEVVAGKGGLGGFGGGGGGSLGTEGISQPAVGGISGGSGSGDQGGGGAAAGPAIFVNLGSVTLSNVAGSGFAATAGTGGNPGTASTAPVFNYAGTVNGSVEMGGLEGALPVGGSGSGTVYGGTPVGQTSAAQTATLWITTAGQPASINVLTQGAASLDFNMASGSTCSTSTSYTVGESCTVNFTFAPSHPGLRFGAITLVDGSGNLLAEASITGLGIGPQVAFLPGSQSTIGGAISSPGGVAVDASGNLYITDHVDDVVLKETYSGGTYTASTIASSSNGIASPGGVAVDGAGNVFIVDYNNNNVYEAARSGSGYAVSLVITSLREPSGIAVDASGDVFVADSVGSQVFRETPSAGSYSRTVVASSSNGLVAPAGVAVDGSGNVYITDPGGPAVYMETPNGSGYTQTAIGSSWESPQGIAVDATGRVFVSDDGAADVVVETPTGGGSFAQTVLPASGLTAPSGVAVDGSGNVYIADYSANKVFKQDYADAPSLTFPSTAKGSTSSAQTVALVNIGNAALTLTGLSYPTDFPEAVGDPQACTSSTSLPSDEYCDLPIEYSPQSTEGFSEAVTLTDNALNVPGSTQSIAVTGIVPSQAAVLTSPTSPGTLAASQTFTWSAGTGVAYYDLYVSAKAFGGYELYRIEHTNLLNSGPLSFPSDGQTIYVQLRSFVGKTWVNYNYTFTEAAPAAATLTSPSPTGSTLPLGGPGATQVFTWTAGAGVTQYDLYIGTMGVGSSNLYNIQHIPAGTLSSSPLTIPPQGQTVYVRLSSQIVGTWVNEDYTFAEEPYALSAMATPLPAGSTLSTSQSFTWTAGTGVTQYDLYVGTTGVGSKNLYDTGHVTALGTTSPVTIPSKGKTVYVRLWSYIAPLSWKYVDYTYVEP